MKIDSHKYKVFSVEVIEKNFCIFNSELCKFKIFIRIFDIREIQLNRNKRKYTLYVKPEVSLSEHQKVRLN